MVESQKVKTRGETLVLRRDSGDGVGSVDSEPPVVLRHPLVAGVLAWLFPGAGHLYQRRFFKAALFFVCIFPLFVTGCFLGSRDDVGAARVVYYSWREGDYRFYFIPQACLGLSAIPAVLQSQWWKTGAAPSPLGRFMAPPLGRGGGAPPTGDEIVKKLHVWYDIGTLLTVVAGLMNLLVVFDAVAGPVVAVRREA